MSEEMPLYMVAESKQHYFNQTVSVMGLNLEDLIFEKMFLLFERLSKYQTKEATAKIELHETKGKLLIETDFNVVLGKSRTNKEEREAYMKPFLEGLENAVEKAGEQIKFYENKLKIINDLINAKETMLNVEGALKD